MASARPPTSESRSIPRDRNRSNRSPMASAARSTMRRPIGSPWLACRSTMGAKAAWSAALASSDRRPPDRDHDRTRPAPPKARAMSPRGDPRPAAPTADLQTDVGTAAFVRDRKAITAETDFAAADQTHPDRSGAGHHYRTVRAAVGPETSSHPVADENARTQTDARSSLAPLPRLDARSPQCRCQRGSRRNPHGSVRPFQLRLHWPP